MAKPLLEVLRDVSLDPTERAAFAEDPSQYLAQHGYEGVPAEDLGEAFGLMHDTLPADTALALTRDPVFEPPDEPGAPEGDAAEVGDLAPFGEVNGDFDTAAGDDLDDDGDGDLDGDDLDDRALDDLGDLDDLDGGVTGRIGDGIDDAGVGAADLDGDLDDEALDDLGGSLETAGGAGVPAATGDLGDDLDDGAGLPDLTDDVDDDLAFGLGSADAVGAEPGAPGDLDTPGGDLDDAGLDDGDPLDLAGPADGALGGLDALDVLGGDALGHDLDDDLDDDLGLMFDDPSEADDLPSDGVGLDDIGSF